MNLQYDEVNTLEIINTVHDLQMADRRLKMLEMSSAVGISGELVHNIFSTEDQNQDHKRGCFDTVVRTSIHFYTLVIKTI